MRRWNSLTVVNKNPTRKRSMWTEQEKTTPWLGRHSDLSISFSSLLRDMTGSGERLLYLVTLYRWQELKVSCRFPSYLLNRMSNLSIRPRMSQIRNLIEPPGANQNLPPFCRTAWTWRYLWVHHGAHTLCRSWTRSWQKVSGKQHPLHVTSKEVEGQWRQEAAQGLMSSKGTERIWIRICHVLVLVLLNLLLFCLHFHLWKMTGIIS